MLIRRMVPTESPWFSGHDELDGIRRQIRGLMGEMEEAMLARPGAIFPALNVTQDEDNLYVRAELPGMKPSDLNVTAVKNRLSLSGSRQIAAEDESASYHRRERAGGHFSRSIVLPVDFQGDKVTADYVDGILTVTLPRTPETKPKQIQVKTA